MLAIHDQFSYQLRTRLQTTCMGLGLVRLLQDARRFEEARTTLAALESGFQGAEADKPSAKPSQANRLTVVTRTISCSSGPTKITNGEALTRPLSLA